MTDKDQSTNVPLKIWESAEQIPSQRSWWFVLVLIYLVFDYARPQEVIPGLSYLRPTLVLTVLLCCCLLLSGKLRRSGSPQTTVILALFVLMAIYVPFARNNYFAFNTTKAMFVMLPVVLSLIICVDSTNRLKTIINVCAGILIYVSAYSIIHGGVGPGNYLVDENDLALYINMWIPISFFAILYEKNIKTKMLHCIAAMTGLASVVLSFSRGGFVGLLAMLGTLFMLSKKKVLTILVLCFMGLMVFAVADTRYWTEMATITDTSESTARERILSWQAAWDMFVDQPLGVGPNNFQVWFPQYQSSELRRGMWGRVAHSLWFTLIAELGIIGTLIYLTLIFFNIKALFFIRKQNRLSGVTANNLYLHGLSNAFLCSMTGYFASATFLSVLYYPHFFYLTSLIVASTNLTIESATSRFGNAVL